MICTYKWIGKQIRDPIKSGKSVCLSAEASYVFSKDNKSLSIYPLLVSLSDGILGDLLTRPSRSCFWNRPPGTVTHSNIWMSWWRGGMKMWGRWNSLSSLASSSSSWQLSTLLTSSSLERQSLPGELTHGSAVYTLQFQISNTLL